MVSRQGLNINMKARLNLNIWYLLYTNLIIVLLYNNYTAILGRIFFQIF